MALVGMVALLTSGLLVLARIFKLGFLADFLSRTALVGFLTGVGVQVGSAMLGDMIGVDRRVAANARAALGGPAGPAVAQSAQARPFALRGREHPARQAIRAEIPGLARRGRRARSPRAPGFTFRNTAFRSSGRSQGGLPSLALPNVTWSETVAVLPVALSCFVMIIAQSAATSRVYAIKHQERVDENADILGLAAANAAAAVSGAFVVNGSPTQTAMADGAGARSQVAQLVFAGDRARRPAVPDRAAAIPAALRAGEHRVHHRGRHGRREGPAETSFRRAGANSCWRS